MSLFSRLDRVREKAQTEAEAEDGVFAVPNIGARDEQAPAPHVAASIDQAPQSAAPAENLSISEAQGAGTPIASFVPVELPPAVPDSPTTEPALESESRDTLMEMPARTPFDRLMAESAEAQAEAENAGDENAEAENAESDNSEMVDESPADEPDFAEATVYQAPVSETTPIDEAPAYEAASDDSGEPSSAEVAEPLPDFLTSSTPEALPEEALPEEALPDFLTPPVSAAPPAPEPVIPAASLPVTPERPIGEIPSRNSPVDRLPLERSAMENPTPGTPAESTPPLRPTAERPFGDRFAGRAGLDRDVEVASPLARTEDAVDPSSEPSRAPLARVESDVAQSEREAKNRALYRRKHLVFDSVLSSIDPRLLQNPTRDGLRGGIEKGVDGALREFNLSLEPSERSWLIEEFLRETTDFGPLVSLLDDPGVNKILVSGSSDVTIEKLGRMERTGISFRDDDHLLSIIRRLAETVGGRIDAKVPLLDRPLPDGARVRAKIPPMAPQPTLTLEKSSGNPFVQLKRQQAERGRGDNLPYAQLRERIQQRLVREFEGDSLSTSNQDRLRGQVEEMINAVILEERVAVTRAERAALVMDLLNEIVGLGPIEPLLNDPDVDEVMVNGPYQIYVERKGKLELSTQRFRDNAHVMQVIDRIVAPLGRRVDEKSPMVDGRLRDGSRFNAVIPPLALSGPTMTIRKFARDPFTMTDLINFGTLSRDAAQFLQAAVEGRLNIVVSGGTGSGKTTTLNVLSSFIPTTERIVTIEDAAELQLRQEHVIRLETRPPNIEGIGEVGIRDLVRNALRMRPDRIVIGECRGGEALDMLQAMNTGHDGSLTTGHSNGPRDMLKRLETMVMMAGFDLPVKAIREQVAMAVQLIVHQERMRDGKRRITAVSELVGMEGDVITMQDIFRFEQERVDDEGRIVGALVPTGLRPKNFDTILDNGVELSMELFSSRSISEPGVRSRLDRANSR